MKLENIQNHCERRGLNLRTQKDELKTWLERDCPVKFNVGLTLMPKKLFYKHLSKRRGFKCTEVFRHPNKQETERMLHRFVELLNRLAYRNAYKRFNKRLNIVFTIEGEKTLTDLHGHFAIAKPDSIPFPEFGALVRKALEMSGEFEIANPNYNPLSDAAEEQYRYKLEVIDSGWQTYITKQLGKTGFANLYLP